MDGDLCTGAGITPEAHPSKCHSSWKKAASLNLLCECQSIPRWSHVIPKQLFSVFTALGRGPMCLVNFHFPDMWHLFISWVLWGPILLPRKSVSIRRKCNNTPKNNYSRIGWEILSNSLLNKQPLLISTRCSKKGRSLITVFYLVLFWYETLLVIFSALLQNAWVNHFKK